MFHIKSDVHLKNSGEKYLDPLDKLLMTKPKSKSMEVIRSRRQQLRKISSEDKRKFVRHGIRLKEGTGPQAYVCIKCSTSMISLINCYKHCEKFIQLNRDLNYPENYHTLDEDNNYPKISLRYKRILNALELPVDDSRTQEEEKKLSELRMEATVLKEEVDESKTKYFQCLFCDIRIDKIEEALVHIKSMEHSKNRSSNRFKGLDKEFLIESERCGQIEIDLARKQESLAISFCAKESFYDHGIRMNNGIEPQAYVCITCDKNFDCLNDAKDHYESVIREEEAKKISGTDEQALINSAKKQLEALLGHDCDQNSTEEADEDFKERITKEGIQELEDSDKNKYYDSICNTYYANKAQVIKHLSLTFHNRCKNEEFMKAVDKQFCCSSNRMDDPEVMSARLQVLQRINDEAKAKFTEEGIRVKDGIGRQAFWCMLCKEHILSPNVESSTLSFVNHINYHPKHVQLLIAQNK